MFLPESDNDHYDDAKSANPTSRMLDTEDSLDSTDVDELIPLFTIVGIGVLFFLGVVLHLCGFNILGSLLRSCADCCCAGSYNTRNQNNQAHGENH